MYEFYDENRDFIHAFIIVATICIVGVWFVCDHYRNEPIYTDTDRTMESIGKRIESIEQRIDRIQERNSAIEKAVSGVTTTVERSRENAEVVADGISRAEERLDGIIQRQGRIENILADVEAANNKGKKNP